MTLLLWLLPLCSLKLSLVVFLRLAYYWIAQDVSPASLHQFSTIWCLKICVCSPCRCYPRDIFKYLHGQVIQNQLRFRSRLWPYNWYLIDVIFMPLFFIRWPLLLSFSSSITWQYHYWRFSFCWWSSSDEANKPKHVSRGSNYPYYFLLYPFFCKITQ